MHTAFNWAAKQPSEVLTSRNILHKKPYLPAPAQAFICEPQVTQMAVTTFTSKVAPNPHKPCMSGERVLCFQERQTPLKTWGTCLHLSFVGVKGKEGKSTWRRHSYLKPRKSFMGGREETGTQFPWQPQSLLDHNLHGRWKWSPCNQSSEVTEKGNDHSSNKTASNEISHFPSRNRCSRSLWAYQEP